MRIDVFSATRRHGVNALQYRPLTGPFTLVPYRTFISRRPTLDQLQNLNETTRTHFPLLNLNDFLRKPRQPNPEVRNVAILGGGITGLTTALLISKDFPHAKITVFEQSNRLGGWLASERLQVAGGDVLFEWGPRSLRPGSGPVDSGKFTASLLGRVLGFEENPPIVAISKTAPASRNRFVYFAGKLVKMPGPGAGIFKTILNFIHKLLSEPIFRGLISQLTAEFTKPRRPASLRDESVGHFVRRRFGPTIADNLVSALFHGIYAGNINNLSARTLIPQVWYLETRDQQSKSGVLMETTSLLFDNQNLLNYRLLHGANLLAFGGSRSLFSDLARQERSRRIGNILAPSSMYTFVDGIQQLSDGIISKLSGDPNVKLSTSTSVDSLIYSQDNRRFTVGTSSLFSPERTSHGQLDASKTAPTEFDYVIATIRPSTLCSLLSTSENHSPISDRAKRAFEAVSKTVNVMVVNLYFTSPTLLPPSLEGFGYLIPASVGLDENPERALGVLFSSNASGPRGANAVLRESRKTADEYASLRENMERNFETDFNRIQRIETLEIYRQRIKDNPDHIDHDLNVAGNDQGWTVVESMEADLKQYEKGWEFEINKLKEQEAAARQFEAQPGFDPEDDFKKIRVGQDTATGTKLTVMLGGHWWEGWEDSDLPTEAEGIEKAKSLLARHLKITDEPEIAKARLQRDCIPQYPVGYRDYMAAIHNDVLTPIGGKFDGKLKVAGAYWQGGVGVNDCVRKATETAVSLYEGWDHCTGLEEYVGDEKWCLVNKKTGAVEPDLMSVNR